MIIRKSALPILMVLATQSWQLTTSVAHATTIYLKEEFSDGEGWKNRWIQSKAKSDYGEMILSAGKFYGDPDKDKGLQTSQDAKFYAIGRYFDQVANNEGKPLVIQFSVKHEQKIDCGGGYIKLLPKNTDLSKFDGESPYYIMFGPDICGATKKAHVTFNYEGKERQIKKDISFEDDQYTHVYTLIVQPNKTYDVLIDNEKVSTGKLQSDWDFLPPETIPDLAAKKPDDWDDREYITDPNDKKPAGWDDIPQQIVDPDTQKPEDWDDAEDGKWEPPLISNPEYKGTWQAKLIKNPNFKGLWVRPEIPNPNKADNNTIDKIGVYTDIGAVAFELWQVKSGTIFDNILITDDPAYARQFADETWSKSIDAEKAMKARLDLEKKQSAEDEKQSAEDEKQSAEYDSHKDEL